MAAIEAELESAVQDKPKRAPRPRKGFAAHLERVEIVIEPEVPAGCEGLEKVLIGEDVSERLDVMPTKFQTVYLNFKVADRPTSSPRSGAACRSARNGIRVSAAVFLPRAAAGRRAVS